MPSLSFGKFIGANTDYSTSQAFVFPKNIPEDGAEPILIAIISCSGEDVFTKVRQLAPSIEEQFFQVQEEEGEQPQLSAKLQKLMDYLKEFLKDVEDLQILLGSLKENILYLLSKGSHKAHLLRDDQVIDLISQNDQLISGYIKPGDRILFLSSKQPDPQTREVLPWDPQKITAFLNSTIENLEEDSLILLNDQKEEPTQNFDPIALVLIESKNLNSKDKIEIPSLDSHESHSKISLPSLKPNLPNLLTPLKKLIPRSKKAKLILTGAIAVLIIFLITSYFLQKSNSDKNQIYALTLNEAKASYEEALAQKDSNPTQSIEKLEQAQVKLAQILILDPKNSQALDLKKQIDENTNSILKIYDVSEPPVFLSLDLIKNGFQTNNLSFSLGKILILDQSQKSLVSVDTTSKTPKIIAGSTQLGDAQSASINGENVFIYSKDNGVLKFDLGTEKLSTISKPDEEWGSISSIYGFGGNVYLLDSIKNQIWKYTPIQSGYSSKFTYLQDGQTADFAGASKLLIDYSVWVLKSGPEILKFTGGQKDFFGVSGLDQNLTSIKSIFVTEEADTVYILDSDNSRVMVFNKKGEYQSQYKGPIFDNASDLTIDEENKRIYLLKESKIYLIELK